MNKFRNQKKSQKINIKSSHPDKSILISKPYEFAHQRDILVKISQPEFTSLCPMTGLPDFGTISIAYIPSSSIIELKSLKMYLLQFRNFGVFYEHLVNIILNDLVSVISPKWMEVKGMFRPRGGISTTVTATYGKKPDEMIFHSTQDDF